MQTHLQTLESIAPTVGVDQKTIAGIMKHHPEATGGMSTPTGREKGSSGNWNKDQKSSEDSNKY
jgi:hypothetical protein